MALTPVQRELTKIAADYRRFLILRRLTVCWAALSACVLLVLLLYRFSGWVLPHAVPVFLGVCAAAGIFVLRGRRRTRIALREIARLVERDDPRLNSLLLAAAEQEPDPKTGALNFLQTRVIEEAARANRQSPWNRKFTERLFLAQCAHMLALCVLSVALLALAFTLPDTPSGIARAGLGLEITPGNVEVEKGSAVAIVAKFRGAVPGEVKLVYHASSGGEKVEPMARGLNDPLFGATLLDLQEDTKYQIQFGRRRSPVYQVKVFEYPELKRADAELVYPAYTGMKPSRIEDTRRISAIEGTDVRYTFYVNKPLKSARLSSTNRTQILLTNLAGSPVEYKTDFPLRETAAFKLELVDLEGRTNKLPADFIFVALKNERPKLKLQSPKGDQRVSALQEVRFEAQAEDDFGMSAFGLAYTLIGKAPEIIQLSAPPDSGTTITQPHETRAYSWMLPLEELRAEPGQLVSYYLWADDFGPDGKARRTQSDIYFAEVRPFEEIFRQGGGDSSESANQQQQGENRNPTTRLIALQKEIISATWNLERREPGSKGGPALSKDLEVVRDSQRGALEQAEALRERIHDDKTQLLISTAIHAMESAEKQLDRAVDQGGTGPLPEALEYEQAAYQALLKMQAREYEVTRNRNRSNSRGNPGEQSRAQRQLDQLELKDEENRYEAESQASPLQSPEQREALQVLNRLKELARRQQDMSERLKELRSALNEAKTPEERRKLERELKRLQDEQRQIVQDMDETRQRMAEAQNQSRMAEARQQLDQTRQTARDAAQQLENGDTSQALSSAARAQRQLEQLSDQFRKSTANQFAEEMRQLRKQARDLEKKHQETAEKIAESMDTPRRSLSEEGPKAGASQALSEQRSSLTNLLRNLRQVTEQSEGAEPLLSRQLYETLRRTSQAGPEKSLETASQLLERNFLPQAAELHRRTDPSIRELREGVEKAARNVLGDEAESLRFARKELEDLASRVERELNRATGGGTNANPGTAPIRLADANARERGVDNQTNRAASAAADAGSTNRSGLARLNDGADPGDPQARSESGESDAEPSAAREGQERGQDQPGQRTDGGNAQQASDHPGSQSGAQQASASARSRNGARQAGDQPRGGARNSQGSNPTGGSRNFLERWAENPNNPDGGGSGPREFEGPLTGRDFNSWSDRLRDLEEVLQDPELRIEAARVRERARTMRGEFKRHATLPQWDLVRNEIVSPMRMLQTRVAEELARLESKEAVVPVDRDPVPGKYSDLVSRYYERLGKE